LIELGRKSGARTNQENAAGESLRGKVIGGKEVGGHDSSRISSWHIWAREPYNS